MLTEKLTRGDSIALTKGLLIAAWRFCHNELALSVSHSLASSPKGEPYLPHSNLFAGITIAPNSEAIYTTSTTPDTASR